MNKRFLSIVAIVAVVLSIANSLVLVRQTVGATRLSATANMPQVISYQGRLTDAAGNPLTGDYDMHFCLYAVPSGGTALWCEDATVHVNYGVFSVLLGSSRPLPAALFDGSDLYLGVAVGSDAEMTPRRRIVSVGYAYRAAEAEHARSADNADVLDGMHADQFASANHSHHALDAADGYPQDALFVDDSGNVGIGTTDPQAQLDVHGIVQARAFGRVTTLFSGHYGEAASSYQFDLDQDWVGFLTIQAQGNGQLGYHTRLYLFSGNYDASSMTLLAENSNKTYITGVSVTDNDGHHTVIISVDNTWLNNLYWSFLPLR